MAERLVLHIGAMKSGTSFLQNVLVTNTALLESCSMKMAGKRWGHQVHAVHELIEHGGPRQPAMPTGGYYDRVVEDIHSWPGTAILSMEFLGPRGKGKIKQLLAAFPGTRVDVVMTARDLTRTLPAMWQESVQNGGVQTWESYLRSVQKPPRVRDGPGKKFWQHQGLASMASRWSEVVGRDRFTLITVPQKGAPPSLLWERFAELLGIGPADADLGVRGNPSIGPASAMVMRAVNERLAANPLSTQAYNRFVKHALAKDILANRDAREPSLGLDAKWVLVRGEKEVAALRALDLRVIGDLDELRPRPLPGIGADEITVDQQLEAALDGLAESVRRWSTARPRPDPKRRRR